MDVKSDSGVYFFVERNTAYNSTGTVIPYEKSWLNIGGAMDLATGVFTVPVNGRYQFNFVAITNGDNTAVILRLNGGIIARGYGGVLYDTLTITVTANLKKGDKIETFLAAGSIFDGGNYYYTQFTGILLEEDLLL